MKIAAITDIHAMAGLLATALADARCEGFDVLLILGDLLTYGVEPQRTLELVADAVTQDGAILIEGNHDAIYREAASVDDAYLARLPGWLRETVEWTAARVPTGAMAAFDWRSEWSCGPLLAAHANPYGVGDWRYLSDPDHAAEAAAVLAQRGYRYGLFGHTHRGRRFECGAVEVFTLGALGQPRDVADARPQWAMIETDGERMRLEQRNIPFDAAAHCTAIRSTTMSSATRDRLCEFFS